MDRKENNTMIRPVSWRMATFKDGLSSSVVQEM